MTEPGYCLCGCGSTVSVGRSYRQGHNSKRGDIPPRGSDDFPNPNPSGLCGCGCGGQTSVSNFTARRANRYKGRHMQFIPGHHTRLWGAEDMPGWKGGRFINDEGYAKIYAPDPSGRRKTRYQFEHRAVMEKVLGRRLERNEQVHHINGDKSDNRPENLELWHRSQPNGVRREDYHCPGCSCAVTLGSF